jgi:hypothetical protein
MNAQAKLWVEALRSGEYKQTSGALKDEFDGYCCLGVLCEISGLEWDRTGLYLPPNVIRWAKLKESNGAYGDSRCLAHDNDCGKSFLEIADIIEQHPELFEDDQKISLDKVL